MARSKSSARWLREHHDDQYVQLAQKEGYRSRAVYKLKELDEKYRLFQGGMTVVDLGAAPGAWSQYIAAKIGDKGRIIACDLLSMDAIAGLQFIQGDFREQAVLEELQNVIQEELVDLVLSDMAPNMSGVDAVDIPAAMYLVELAHDLARQILKPGATFVCKLLQGQGSDQWLQQLRQDFAKVIVRKPKASRPRSREVYVVATQFNRVKTV